MKKTQINSTIANLLSSQEHAVESALKMQTKVIAMQNYIAQVLALTPADVKYVSTYGTTVGYTVQVKGFKNAATKRLLESYMALEEKFGMRLEMSSSDNPEYNRREFLFKFYLPENNSYWDADLTVRVSCELIEGGNACRRVQVGEKVETIRTPEYQFICK